MCPILYRATPVSVRYLLLMRRSAFLSACGVLGVQGIQMLALRVRQGSLLRQNHREEGLRTSRANGTSPRLEGSRLEAPKQLAFQSETKGWKNSPRSQLRKSAQEFPLARPFCCIQVFSGLEEALPPRGGWGQSALLSLQIGLSLVQKHLYRHTQKNVWPNI